MTNVALTDRERLIQKENLKRVHKDRMRPLRVLEYVDNSAIFENSPVEVREGYVISDRDNGDLFLILSFRSMSEKPIASLRVRISLFRDHKPVPYERKEYVYSWQTGTFGIRTLNGEERKEKEIRGETTIRFSETFGDGIYLPIPSTYFSKLQVELQEVEFNDGNVQHLGLTAGARADRFAELRDELQDAYSEVNIFRSAESVHPIRVLPKEGENVWLCCCGHKNPKTVSLCESCGRDRSWQLENLTVDNLEKKEKEMERDPGRRVLHDLTKYKPKTFETDAEVAAKVEMCNKVMEHLAIQEKEKEKKPFRIFLSILLILAGIAVLYGLLQLVFIILTNLGFYSSGSGDASQAADTAARIFRHLF